MIGIAKKPLRDLSVPKADLIAVIEKLDADKNDMISLDEVADVLDMWKKKLKDAIKYSRRR